MRSVQALKICLRVLILILLIPVSVLGQAWSGILPATRAVDWTNTGIPSGIPSGSWTQSGSTISSGASTSTIQTALNACSGNHYVLLGSGAFTLSASLAINTSGCELRGSGPTSTTVTLAGHNILMGDGSGNQGSTPGGLGVTNLSTLTQGSTVLTVASTTGLSVGQVVMVYQGNSAWVNPVGGEGNQNATMCPSSPGLAFFGCSTRSASEMVKITNVNSGLNQITIAAPGLSQTYTSGLTPQVFFWSTTGPTSSDGIRNIKIDAGASVHSDFAIAFVFCHQCWAQNVTVVNGHRAAVYSLFSYQTEVRDSYISESNTAGAPTEYGIEVDRGSMFKIENNIIFGTTSPVVIEASYGGVVGYNYTLNTATDNLFPTLDTHLSHSYMLLLEGNSTSNVDWDFVHGSASQNTSFRNFYWGNNPNKTNYRTPYNADAYNRYNNLVANVLGDPTLHINYVCDQANPQGSDNFIYGLGFGNGCFGGASPAYDATTETSIIRWGNWDAVTWCTNGGHGGTACGTTGTNGIRFCTGSGAGNAACTASETASTDPTFPGLSSPSTTFPASFYNGSTSAHASCGTGLSFWKNPSSGVCPQYPAIGPDVAGTLNVITDTATHATQIPAQLCYNATAKTSGFLTAFDAAACYANDPAGSIVATPTSSPAAGTYAGPTPITLSTTTGGATLCYTLDLSVPTANGAGTCTHGTTYSGPFTLTLGSTTVKAIGSLSGSGDSSILTVAYTIIPQTWYVRADGGGRYSAARVTAGFTGAQIGCNGLADAPYPGSGTNQPCAYNDYRFLYDDQTFGAGASSWVISGGDTVLIRNGPWRVGFAQGTSSGDVWCKGLSGAAGCTNPTIPAGTAAQHTRILGENYNLACTTGVGGNATQLFGGFSVGAVLMNKGAQYVDEQCLELTDHSQCIVHGSPNPDPCSSSFPLSDYASEGSQTNTSTHDLFLTDVWIHGTTDRGIIGPIGGLVTAQRVTIGYSPMAGWDFDDGSSTPSVNADWRFLNSNILFSGCNEEYPITHTYPARYCFGQGSGGYGDGVGGPVGTCIGATITNSSSIFNTQDAFDLGHNDTRSGPCYLTVSNTFTFGNSGAAGVKWGSAPNPQIFVNNLLVGNCLRMSVPLAGAPTTYNQYLGDFCRAGDTLSFNGVNDTVGTIANNTIIAYAPTTFDIGCNDPTTCASTIYNMYNNVVSGYDNPGTYTLGGQAGGPGGYCLPGCNSTTHAIGHLTTQYNDYFHVRTITCPTGNTGEICTSPLLTQQPTGQGVGFTETELDVYMPGLATNFIPLLGSPLTVAGFAYAGIPATDYLNRAYTIPPPIGALNPVSSATIYNRRGGNINARGSIIFK